MYSSLDAQARPFALAPSGAANLRSAAAEVNRIESVAGLMTSYMTLNGFVIALLLLRAVKLMEFQPRLGLVSRTLLHAATDLLHFFLLFVVVFMGFVVVGHLLFGAALFTPPPHNHASLSSPDSLWPAPLTLAQATLSRCAPSSYMSFTFPAFVSREYGAQFRHGGRVRPLLLRDAHGRAQTPPLRSDPHRVAAACSPTPPALCSRIVTALQPLLNAHAHQRLCLLLRPLCRGGDCKRGAQRHPGIGALRRSRLLLVVPGAFSPFSPQMGVCGVLQGPLSRGHCDAHSIGARSRMRPVRGVVDPTYSSLRSASVVTCVPTHLPRPAPFPFRFS